MAGFMTKEELASEAERLGVDLEGLTWPQKQKAVMAAKTAENPGWRDEERSAEREEIARLKAELAKAKAEAKHVPVPQVPVHVKVGKAVPQPTIEDYENVVLIASPEQKPTQYQPQKWYEEVGEEKQTTDVYFGVGKQSPFAGDMDSRDDLKTATYQVRPTGRKVEAQSTMPKYSCLITYRPTKDLAAVAEFNGHRGYLWTHHRLENVKHLLDEMGALEEFKGRWLDAPGRLFYLGGLLCCDIRFTEGMFEQIRRELKKRARAEERWQ